MGPCNSSYLSDIGIFHFHDYGRESREVVWPLFWNSSKDKTIEKERAWKRSWMPAMSSRANIWQLHMMKYHDNLIGDMKLVCLFKNNKMLPAKARYVQWSFDPTCNVVGLYIDVYGKNILHRYIGIIISPLSGSALTNQCNGLSQRFWSLLICWSPIGLMIDDVYMDWFIWKRIYRIP